jgi:hypothetical protein
MTVVRRLLRFAVDWVRAASSALYLLTLGLLSSRLRGALRRVTDEVALWPSRGERMDVRSPDALGDASQPLVLPDLVAADGNVSLLELGVLARLVRSRSPRVIWEIGTFDGRTTRVLAANAPDAEVHTLDLPPSAESAHALSGAERQFVEKDASGARFVGTAEAARITQHLGDSARYDLAPWGGRTDLVFVDGSHVEAYVRSDTARARALTDGRSAVVVWHDYGAWPDVTRVLDELAAVEPLYRVAGTTLVVWEWHVAR